MQPWAFIGGAGSQSFSGRLGLIAASFQNKGYEYAKVLYDNQQPEDTGWLTGRQMALIAASVNGLNLSKWQKSVNGSAVKQIASTVDRLATQAEGPGNADRARRLRGRRPAERHLAHSRADPRADSERDRRGLLQQVAPPRAKARKERAFPA